MEKEMKLFEELNKELGTKFKSDEEINWITISSFKYALSESFIEKWKDKVDWNWISMYQDLSEEFIEKFQDKVEWGLISNRQKLSEQFIEKFQDKINWENISSNQELSEQFIEKFQDKVNWNNISYYQHLSENFIEKYDDKVDWFSISLTQKLSKEFIEKHKDKINLELLKEYNILTKLNINKDWFIAYVNVNDYKINYFFLQTANNIQSESIILGSPSNSFKVKVYYKNLRSTKISNKVKIIRKVNKYKICGKK